MSAGASHDGLDVLLVEPYFAGSHRQWAEGYVRHSAHRVRLVTHAGSFWRWRLRGGSVTLARAIEADVASHGRPDVVLVSDLVNLAALLGLARRALDGVPVALYLHENQLLYPPPPPRGRQPSRRSTADPEEAALVNWVSLAAADAVIFNSAFHRDALLGALAGLLGRAPDHPHADLVADVAARATVVPVGVDLDDLVAHPRDLDPTRAHAPLVVWNQRWEHDKDPEAFFDALLRLADEGVAFRLALAGENVRVDPREFDDARVRLGGRVVHVGHLPEADYRELLTRADVVVSTARHEFFGVAIVEAMAAGAVPLLPDRLSYPELVPERYHESVLYSDGALTDGLRRVLADLGGARAAVDGLRSEMLRFDWATLAPVYDDRLRDLVSAAADRS
jgi:glycosyltransferase involved in cell wall biosynthesis